VSRIAVNSARYEVRIGGSGPGLLLLHGFTGSGANWAPMLPALRRQATTIQVDLLGHGRSDSPADPARHAVERQAADLGEIVRSVAAGPVDVLGYSFGARIALTLALAEPSVVRRLILESPSAGIAEQAEREARRRADDLLAEAIERDGIEAFVDHWEDLALFASHYALPASTRLRLHGSRLRNNPAGLAASLRGAGQGVMMPLHYRIGEIHAPTLVICGEVDPARARAEFVAAHIPGASLAVIPAAGHTPHLESPARFRAAAVHFLTATATSTATATNPQETH
jgi:2-succinyl-6-hydroxy-2,4-cyclohexadiene-1-carboxylate synthase